MNGFADGLASGFKAVSDALNEHDRNRLAEEDARQQRDFRRDQLNSQIGLQNLELQNKHAALQHNQDVLNETVRHNKATEGATAESVKGQNTERLAKVGIEQKRLENDSARVQNDWRNTDSQIAERNSTIEGNNWKTSLAQQNEARKQAGQILTNVATMDPATGQLALNIPRGQEQDVLGAMQQYGIPTQALSQNFGNYQRDVRVLQGALAHDNREALMKNPAAGQAVLGAFNNVFGSSINQNVGKPYTGSDPRLKGAIEAKKTDVGIQMTRGKDGKPNPNSFHVVIRLYYTDKNGNELFDKNGQPLYDDGPMIGRDNDPNAPVRQISEHELVRSLDAHQKFGDMLAQSPELMAQVKNLVKSQQKGKGQGAAPKGYQSVVVPQGEDELGNKLPPSLQVINKDTGLTKEQEILAANPPKKSATNSPNAASEATMGTSGPGQMTHPSLDQALRNVGALH